MADSTGPFVGPDSQRNAGFDVDYLRERVRQSVDDLTHQRWRNLGIALVLMIVGGAIALHQLRDAPAVPKPEDVLPRATPAAQQPASTTPGAPTSEIVVHVAGAVARPGVYTTSASDRVDDVIREAGGLVSDADSDRINLAAKVSDGQRIYVPKKGEPAVVAEGAASTDPTGTPDATAIVDLNTATTAELDTLPGVGPATAQAIVQYRSTNGPFSSVADLSKVKGIGPSKLNELRSRVRV